MNKILTTIAAFAFSGAVMSDEMATPDEAKAMSERAQAAVNEMGSEKAFAAFAAESGDFRDKDLYVFCMDMEGVMLSHPVKPQLIGKNLIAFDKYGDLLFQDMIAVAKDPGQGWVDYNWPYPGSDEVKAKTSYVMANNEGIFCGVGAYK